MSANITKIAKVTRIFFLLAKNIHDKYRKNIKSNTGIKDLGREEAKKGPEMSSNVAINAKVTRIFLGN